MPLRTALHEVAHLIRGHRNLVIGEEDYRSLFIHVERSVALFWTAGDLENQLRLFQDYFNRQPVHSGFGSATASP